MSHRHEGNSPALTGTLRTMLKEINVGSVIKTPKFIRKLNTRAQKRKTKEHIQFTEFLMYKTSISTIMVNNG